MARITGLAYGVVCYAIFFGTFLYTVGFLGGFGVPKTIDSGPVVPLTEALLVNLGLLTLFAIQHSVMARPAFKQWLTRFVPRPLERSTYVLASSLAFILLFWQWRPIPGTVWQLESGVGYAFGIGAYLFGYAVVLYSTFLIDHFDLFGLRQVVLNWKNVAYTEKRFVTPGAYKFIRHPLYVGWFIVFWATPHMTFGHLLMAVVSTAYIVVAIRWEEKDLSDLLGDEYRRYRARTPMFVPRVGGARPQPVAAESR